MIVLFTGPITKAEPEPAVGYSYCVFFHVLFTTPTHVHQLSEGNTRGWCRDGPTGRNPAEFLQRGTEPYRNEVTSLEVHDKWNQSHQSLSLPSQTAFPLRASQEYIVGTQTRTSMWCLSKEKQRSTQRKLYECQPGSLCSVGFPAVKSKQQRDFFTVIERP